MENRNQTENTNEPRNTPNNLEFQHHDRQGIDKAPGEETAGDLEDVVSDTQRGKNKVDGDPEEPSDQPIEQSR